MCSTYANENEAQSLDLWYCALWHTATDIHSIVTYIIPIHTIRMGEKITNNNNILYTVHIFYMYHISAQTCLTNHSGTTEKMSPIFWIKKIEVHKKNDKNEKECKNEHNFSFFFSLLYVIQYGVWCMVPIHSHLSICPLHSLWKSCFKCTFIFIE